MSTGGVIKALGYCGFLFAGMSGIGYMAVGLVLRNKSALDRMKNFGNQRLIATSMVGILIYSYVVMEMPKISMRSGQWPWFPVTYLYAIVGCALFAVIAFLLTVYMPHVGGVLQYVGRNSLVFVCTNHPAIRVGRKIVGLIFKTETVLSTVLVFMVSILIIVIITEFFNRTPLRILIGKR